MNVIPMPVEQFAEVISFMTIAEATDLGASIAHQGTHPVHGEIIAVSNAVEPSLMTVAGAV